jgi:endonuclease/exonuclease/phosphatase family metal-dependent hydrolase
MDQSLAKIFSRSELEWIKRDAYSSEGKSPEERTAMFEGLMEAVEVFRAHLSPEERERRRRIADLLQPRPDPWWRNFRKEALAEYECQTSST